MQFSYLLKRIICLLKTKNNIIQSIDIIKNGNLIERDIYYN